MVFWVVGNVVVMVDMLSMVFYLFYVGNVVDGKFFYVGSVWCVCKMVVLVLWNDLVDCFIVKVEFVQDVDGIVWYGIQQMEVMVFGCIL